MPKINSKREHNNHKEMQSPSISSSKPLAEENKFDAYRSRYKIRYEEEN